MMSGKRLAIVVLWLCACGSRGGMSPSPNPDANPDPDPQRGTGAGGIVVANADGSLEIAQAIPGGAHAVPGADVRLVGLRANQLAHGTTAADGTFSLILGSGTADKAAIEVRRNATSAAPDLSFPVSLVDGVTMPAGAAFAVTRDQAIAGIMAYATPASLVAGTFNPLPAGALVAPAYGDENSQPSTALDHTVAAEGEYLFLIDPTPTSLWGHVVEYDLVNASTGAVTRLTGESWLPSVNGVMLFSYTGELAIQAVDPMASSPVMVSGEAIQLPDESMTMAAAAPAPTSAEPRPLLAPDPADLFAFIIVGTPEDWFVEDAGRIKTWLQVQAVPLANIVVSGPTLLDGGTSNTAQTVLTDFDTIAMLIHQRKQAGGCPTLFVYVASHSNKLGQIILSDGLIEEGVRKVLGISQFTNIDDLIPFQLIPDAAKIRVLIQSCYGFFHIARLQAAVQAIPEWTSDVEIYTASGTNTATGESSINAVAKAIAGFHLLDLVAAISPTNDTRNGAVYTAKWLQGATMDVTGELNLPSGTFTFNAGTTGPQMYKHAGGPPVITNVTPGGGRSGDLVTITGKNLGGLAASVMFNGVQAAIASGDNNSIVVTVPTSTTGKLEVDGCCGAVYWPDPFLYVTSGYFTPTHGLPGTKVAIPGTGLGGASATVMFGTHPAVVDPASTDTLLLVTVPEGAGDQNSIYLAGTSITVGTGQDTFSATNSFTGPFLVSAPVTFYFTNTNGGANTTLGAMMSTEGTIYGAGAGPDNTRASVSVDGTPFGGSPGNFGIWVFDGLVGTLSTGSLDVTGASEMSTNVTMTLVGTVGPDGTGSGYGSESNQGMTITFDWNTAPM